MTVQNNKIVKVRLESDGTLAGTKLMTDDGRILPCASIELKMDAERHPFAIIYAALVVENFTITGDFQVVEMRAESLT